MPAATIGLVVDRINSLISENGFTQSRDYFDFDRQPEQMLDLIYRVDSMRQSSQGYMGGDQVELHIVNIWVSRRIKSDSHGAARQVKADLDSIEQALWDEVLGGASPVDFMISDGGGPTADVRLPSDPNSSYVVGRFSAIVDFDRDL